MLAAPRKNVMKCAIMIAVTVLLAICAMTIRNVIAKYTGTKARKIYFAWTEGMAATTIPRMVIAGPTIMPIVA